jgi:hypothetical protein
MHCFGLVFKLPSTYSFYSSTSSHKLAEAQLITLHAVISAGTPSSNGDKVSCTPRHVLNECFRVTQRIAVAVFCLHSYEWVHELIRSQNILFLNKESSNPLSLAAPFLIGFEASCSSDGFSSPEFGSAVQEETRFNMIFISLLVAATY